MALRASVLTQALLYKFRYFLGYGLLVVLLVVIVSVDIGSIPSGLSAAEMNQAVVSNGLRLSLDFSWIVNAPYNFLQQLSVSVLGLSRLSLVLPSLLFGSLTIIIFTLSMRHWFRDSVAIVSTAIVITSSIFIGMIRGGTPEIMLAFWTSLLLFGAMKLLVKHDRAFFWKLMVVLSTIGLIYTPFGVYPAIAILVSALFHPHVRSRLRHIKTLRLTILVIITAAGIAPVIVYLVQHPSGLNVLFGFDQFAHSAAHLRQNLSQIYDVYFNFAKNGFSGTLIIPAFNIASFILMILGLLQTFKDRYTARSYVLLSWLSATIITLLLAPNMTALVFMPSALLLAIGVETLIKAWYDLFPKNPYARLAGLIPLSILFLGITVGNITHYFNNHRYLTNESYSQSLTAIESSLKIEGDHPVILLTGQNDVNFYKILQAQHKKLTVTTTSPEKINVPTFVLPNVSVKYPVAPSRILTSPLKNDSVILRVYRPQ